MLLDENGTTGNVVTEATSESAQGDQSTTSEPGEGDQSPKKKRRKRSSKKLRTVSVDSGITEEVRACYFLSACPLSGLKEIDYDYPLLLYLPETIGVHDVFLPFQQLEQPLHY